MQKYTLGWSMGLVRRLHMSKFPTSLLSPELVGTHFAAPEEVRVQLAASFVHGASPSNHDRAMGSI